MKVYKLVNYDFRDDVETVEQRYTWSIVMQVIFEKELKCKDTTDNKISRYDVPLLAWGYKNFERKDYFRDCKIFFNQCYGVISGYMDERTYTEFLFLLQKYSKIFNLHPGTTDTKTLFEIDKSDVYHFMSKHKQEIEDYILAETYTTKFISLHFLETIDFFRERFCPLCIGEIDTGYNPIDLSCYKPKWEKEYCQNVILDMASRKLLEVKIINEKIGIRRIAKRTKNKEVA